MKVGKEAWLMIGILVAAIALFAVFIAPSIFVGDSHPRGEPNDVTSVLTKELIVGNGRPERGSKNPRYTLVEFGDYQCASCAKAVPIVFDLLKTHQDLRYIFRHATIATGHQFARIAARAAEAAALQHRFWEMHDALFANQDAWTTADDPRTGFSAVAELAGLDGPRFKSDMQSKSSALDATVANDLDAATTCSVNDTPSFFLITPERTWAAVGPVGLKKLQDSAKYWK